MGISGGERVAVTGNAGVLTFKVTGILHFNRCNSVDITDYDLQNVFSITIKRSYERQCDTTLLVAAAGATVPDTSSWVAASKWLFAAMWRVAGVVHAVWLHNSFICI